jgi:hypothetical protein
MDIESVPPRPIGSIRRTSSIDVVRPDGITSPTVVMNGRCRDVITTSAGGDVAADVKLALTIAVMGATIESITSSSEADLSPLVGRSAMSKFRAALGEVVPDEVERRTALHRLLDDVPGANLVSGYAYAIVGLDTRRSAAGIESRADLCAGWINDGEMMRNARAGDLGLRLGPPAPVIATDDPLGFHELPSLPEHSFRRHRRMDVIPGDGGIRLDGFFRDVYFSADGPTSIHEYGYAAELDVDLVVQDIDVTPGTLPWDECPGAAVSAPWLVGEQIGSIDALVRSRFKGVHTCTHLNDALRTLDDVAALQDALVLSAD